jgi:hypothetical protein
LDTSNVTGNCERSYGLCHLNVAADIASPLDIARFKKSGPLRKVLHRGGLTAAPYWECNIVRERFFHFDKEILGLQGDAYLEGYWQSERYFSDIQEVIRSEFAFLSEPDAENERIGKEIQDTNAVSIHVRRGDYVSNPETNRVHGVCSLDYYIQAVRQIVERVKEPHFFVFSDDPPWVKANLFLDHRVTYVTHNFGDKSYEDLRLMSSCRHHIIANSSFSWWGAWLNPRPDKIVVAPERWFNNSNADTRDLFPAGWVRM